MNYHGYSSGAGGGGAYGMGGAKRQPTPTGYKQSATTATGSSSIGAINGSI